MDFERLRFYCLRLCRSSWAELVARAREKVFVYRLEREPGLFRKNLPEDIFDTVKKHNLRFPDFCGRRDGETLSRLLAGEQFTLSHDASVLRDFEERQRGRFFAKVRQGQGDPDIRAVWEPARLQHLMVLLHYLAGEEEDAAKMHVVEEYVRKGLLYWLADNPFPYGPHYISVMECGLRIPVFLRALLVLDGFTSDEKGAILTAVYQHGWLIRNRLSLHSSLGNHTIAEAVGLVMAGALFADRPEGKEWLDKGIELLEQECTHQILADGGPVEQSFSYHRFVLDLYWLAIGFLEDNNLHDCAGMKKRVQAGERFLSAVQGAGESLPMIGDSDDGHALGPGLAPRKEGIDCAAGQKEVEVFPQSGYSLFRGQGGLRVIFDHGPLGMAPLYNHGHGDALAVFLSVGDKDFFIDPGTYKYNGEQELRRYFKGTAAHNTVCIDGFDQARQVTSFIWDKPFCAEGRYEKDGDGRHVFIGRHDGYRQRKIPVTHIRKVSCDRAGEVVIEDRFEGEGEHEFALHFHLHPDVEVRREDGRLMLVHGAVCLEMEMGGDEVELLRGRREPLAGWYSPCYGVMVPSPTLRVVKRGGAGDVGFCVKVGVVAGRG